MPNPHRLIPTSLGDYPVVAWLPTLRHAASGEAVAVVYRTEPECADAPYAVLTARPRDNDRWKTFDGVYDLDLNAAVKEAATQATR